MIVKMSASAATGSMTNMNIIISSEINGKTILDKQDSSNDSCMLELRKEKSRDAARSRRGKENYEFYELARLLPLPAAITSQLDKASIIRLTISYLKLRDFSCHGDPQWTSDAADINGKGMPNHRQLDMLDPFENRQGTHILQSLDGFAFILASDGRFLYISETVSIYLGLSQVEMAGSSIFDYVHQEDHTEMAEHLGLCLVSGSANASPLSGSDGPSSPSQRPRSPSEKGYVMILDSDKSIHKSFSIRMKSTLTKRGMHVKTSGYRVVHIVGSSRCKSSFGLASQGGQQGSGPGNLPVIGLVGMAIALPPPTVTELRLELDTFILRLTPDFKVTYCDPIVSDLLGLTPEDVNDRLLYDLCHAADLKHLKQSHTDILNKGQVLTDYYRLMTRQGGYVWVQTCASILFNNKNPDDHSILAINYVISDVRDRDCAMDLWQLTGDTNATMSSCSNCPIREATLMGLRLNKDRKMGGKPSTSASTSDSSTIGSLGEKLNDIQGSKENDVDERVEDDFSDSAAMLKTGVIDNSEGRMTTDVTPTNMADLKNKRRKMDNPRKRRKSDPNSKDNACPKNVGILAVPESSPLLKESKQTRTDGQLILRQSDADSLKTANQGSIQSPCPEDLSIKKPRKMATNEMIMSSHQSPSHVEDHRLGAVLPQIPPPLLIHNPAPPGAIPMTGNSVQDLEAAMNRHLPHQQPDEDVSCPMELSGNSAISKSQPVCSDALTPQTVTSWPATPKNDTMDNNNKLTASNFLRSLYTTRESVIKTGSRSQPQTYLSAETPSSLLTPPEPDPDTLPCKNPNSMYSYSGKSTMTSQTHTPAADSAPFIKDVIYDTRDPVYKEGQINDQFPFIPYKDHLSSTYIDHISSSTYKDHLTSSYKDFPQFKDIVPAFSIPNLMSPNNRIHQTYPNLSHHFPVSLPSQHIDACSITPPSSNSPDLVKSHLSQSTFDQMPNCPVDSGNLYSVSNKHFSPNIPPGLHSSSSPTNGYHQRYAKTYQQYSVGLNGQDLSKSGYYGMGSSPVGSMYMDHPHNPTGQYETCPRATAIPWY